MDIKIKDVSVLLDSYLKSFGYGDLKTIIISDKQNLFKKIIGDYKTGSISLDEVSALSEKIWWTLDDKEKKGLLGTMLMSGSELSFYERQIEDPEMAKNFVLFFKEILGYKE